MSHRGKWCDDINLILQAQFVFVIILFHFSICLFYFTLFRLNTLQSQLTEDKYSSVHTSYCVIMCSVFWRDTADRVIIDINRQHTHSELHPFTDEIIMKLITNIFTVGLKKQSQTSLMSIFHMWIWTLINIL